MIVLSIEDSLVGGHWVASGGKMGQRAMYGLRELLQPLLWYYRVKPSVLLVLENPHISSRFCNQVLVIYVYIVHR
jgi:hypothetical protein